MAGQLAPLLTGHSKVLTLQNGVEAPDEVARFCDRSAVLAGVCRLMSYVVEPGRIRHSAVAPRIEMGALSGGRSTEAEAACSALDGCAGVSARLSNDIQAILWDKFLFIAPFSAVGAATRKPAGVWRDVAESRALFTAAMTEIVQLAQARGVALPHHAVARTLGFTDQLPADTTSSMQRDLLEGRPSELEAQTGAIVRLGAESGIPVPANAFLYAALLPAERQARTFAKTKELARAATSSAPQIAATRS
jgi:2-dehydropantoate 2-reductase